MNEREIIKESERDERMIKERERHFYAFNPAVLKMLILTMFQRLLLWDMLRFTQEPLEVVMESLQMTGTISSKER